MKFTLFTVIVILVIHVQAQNHTIGIGVGNANLAPTSEIYYSFNIHRLYIKADYAMSYANNTLDDYIYLNHFGSILGFQTNAEKRFIFHTGMGIRYLTAKNPPKTFYQRYIENQWGPIINIGTSYSINKKHLINFDGYFANPHDNGGGRSSSSNGYFELRFAIGYAYRFIKYNQDRAIKEVDK